MPGVIAAAVIEFIPTVGDYITPMMVGGPKGMMFGQIIAASSARPTTGRWARR